MNSTLQSQLAPFFNKCYENLSSAHPVASTQATPEISSQTKEVLAEASRAMKQWETSPEGQAKLRAMEGMTLVEIQQELIALLQSPIFAPTLELISKPSFPILKHPIQSVSAALKVEVDFLVGFSGSIGVAIDPQQLIQFLKDPRQGSLTYVTFLTGWINDGLDSSAITGIEIGVSGSAPNDISGFSKGFEGTIDIISDLLENPEIPGLTGQIYKGSSEGSWGATVGLVWGAGMGLERARSYTFILTNSDLQLPPIYQPDADHMLIITQITCINANRNPDGVYFYFTPDGGTQYRYPTWDHRFMTDDDNDPAYYQTWYPGRSVKFNDSVTVALWDEQAADTDPLGDAITFYYDDFANVHSDTEWKKVYRAGDMGNGWNEIEYHVYVQLIY